MDTTIPIIIPSYEPDERLLLLLESLQKEKLEPIIIVNDGSSDKYNSYFQTAQNKYNAIILTHDINKGKGRALKTAFSYCLTTFPDMAGCITADSDGQHTPSAIIDCKTKMFSNPTHLILGVRDFSGNDVPAKSQFGNNLTKKVFKSLYKVYISDTQTGLRGIPKSFMEILDHVPGERFEFETRMLIKAVETNISITEYPIETIYDSKENHSTHFKPIIDSIRIYKVFGFAFGKFILSSLSSSIVDLLLFQLFCSLLRTNIAGIKYVAIATILARIISAIYNYLVNFYFVFKSKKSYSQSAVRYFLLAVLQMGCSALLTTGLISITGINFELAVKIPVDTLLFLLSYHIQKQYVY